MKFLFQERKGQNIGLWIGILSFVFIMGVCYIAMAQAQDTIYNYMAPKLTGDTLTTAQKVSAAFHMAPILVILVAFLVGVVSIFRRQPEGF